MTAHIGKTLSLCTVLMCGGFCVTYMSVCVCLYVRTGDKTEGGFVVSVTSAAFSHPKGQPLWIDTFLHI